MAGELVIAATASAVPCGRGAVLMPYTCCQPGCASNVIAFVVRTSPVHRSYMFNVQVTGPTFAAGSKSTSTRKSHTWPAVHSPLAKVAVTRVIGPALPGALIGTGPG